MTSSKGDQLSLEVADLKKRNTEVVDAMVDLETDQKCKDEYIDYLAILLGPYLALLPPEVVDEIRSMLKVLGWSLPLQIFELQRWSRLLLMLLLLLLMLDLLFQFL